jgi:membrane associated rhomboid family serine protease
MRVLPDRSSCRVVVAFAACLVPSQAALAAAVLMTRSVRADRTSIYWLRAGAVCGVIAVAVQSIWDTGLRMPANGALFAVIAAIAMHEPRPASPAGSRERTHR